MVKAILKNAPSDLVRALCECSLNVLKGNIKLSATQTEKTASLQEHLTDARVQEIISKDT